MFEQLPELFGNARASPSSPSTLQTRISNCFCGGHPTALQTPRTEYDLPMRAEKESLAFVSFVTLVSSQVISGMLLLAELSKQAEASLL